jgi:hypothetical protein
MRRYLLGGVVVEPRVHSVLFLCFRNFDFLYFLFFIFDLFCKKIFLSILYRFGPLVAI